MDLHEKEPVLLTLELKGVQPPAPKSKSLRRLRRRSEANTETIPIDGSSATEGKFFLKIMVPEGYHLSKVRSCVGLLIMIFRYCMLFCLLHVDSSAHDGMKLNMLSMASQMGIIFG